MPVLVKFFEWFGEFGSFCARLARTAFVPPYERQEFVHQLDEVGARSLLLVALAGAATGVVLSLETRDSLMRFGAKPLLPAVIVISIIKESGPIITGLMAERSRRRGHRCRIGRDEGHGTDRRDRGVSRRSLQIPDRHARPGLRLDAAVAYIGGGFLRHPDGVARKHPESNRSPCAFS